MIWFRSLILPVVIILFAAAGCTTQPEPKTQPASHDRWQPRMDTAEVYETLGVAITEDTRAVAVVAWAPLWEALGASFLPLANPDATPGATGTVDGVRDELSMLWNDRYGFDPAAVEGMVLAMDEEGDIRGAVVLGALKKPLDAEPVDAGDHRAFRISEEASALLGSGYLATFEAPDPAFVFSEDLDELERMLDSADAHDRPPTHRELTELMQLTEGARVASATTVDLIEHIPYLDIDEFPDRGVYSLGNELRVTAFGTDEQLEETAETVETLFDRLVELMGQAHTGVADKDPGVQELTIYGYHGLEAIAAQLDPQFDDGRLDYRVDVGGGLLSVLMSLTTIAVAHHAPAPTDVGPMHSANKRTAEIDVRRLRESVQTYYTIEGELPETLDELTRGTTEIFDEVPTDPWGNDYIYEIKDDRKFEIYSAGPDGKPGTDDDIHMD